MGLTLTRIQFGAFFAVLIIIGFGVGFSAGGIYSLKTAKVTETSIFPTMTVTETVNVTEEQKITLTVNVKEIQVSTVPPPKTTITTTKTVMLSEKMLQITSLAYLEFAKNKPQKGNSWSVVNDSSSWLGSSMKVSNASQNGGVLFGPYIDKEWNGTSMLNKSYTINFGLKVSSINSTSNVTRMDVSCNEASKILASKTIKAEDFLAPNTWQNFQLTFTVPSSLTSGIEFRLRNLNNGVTDLYADYILVDRS